MVADVADNNAAGTKGEDKDGDEDGVLAQAVPGLFMRA